MKIASRIAAPHYLQFEAKTLSQLHVGKFNILNTILSIRDKWLLLYTF